MKQITAKDIQRIIASTNAQDASKEILQLFKEELEVPVAGVTDEEIKNYSWKWAEDNNGHGPDKYFADCNFRCGATWMRDKLAVTGNKPLKTEAIDFLTWSLSCDYRLNPHCEENRWRHISDIGVTNRFILSPGITTEELFEEYLRLCTGGGEKE